MAKFHIGRGGKAAICSARKGKCPFGSDEEHFRTREEANHAAQERLSKDNNIMQSNSKKSLVSKNTIKKLDTDNPIENLSIDGVLDKKAIAVANLIAVISSDETVDEFQYNKAVNALYEVSSNLMVGDEYWENIELAGNKAMLSEEYNKNTIEVIDKYAINLGTYDRTIEDEKENYVDLSNHALEVVQKMVDNNTDNRTLKNISDELKDSNTTVNFMYDMGDGVYALSLNRKHPFNSKFITSTYAIDAVNGIEDIQTKNISVFSSGENRDAPYTYPHKMGLYGISREERKMMSDNMDFSVMQFTFRERNPFFRENIQDTRERIFDKLRDDKAIEKYNKVLHRNIAISSNVSSGNTYLQRKYEIGELRKFSNKTKSELYQTGTALLKENQEAYAQKTLQNKKVQDKIKRIKNSKYGELSENKKETEISKKTIESLDHSQKEAISDYTLGEYKDYASKSHGFNRSAYVAVTDEKIEALQNSIKKIESESVSRSRFLYRGSRIPEGMRKETFLSYYDIGDVVVTNKFTSTTKSGEVMSKFSSSEKNLRDNNEELNFIYYTKKGADISSISRYESEKETIIGIGEKMVVLDKGYDKNGVAYIVFADSEK